MASVRRLVNRSKDYALFNPALERFWLARARGRIAAMLYHQVDEPGRNDFLARGGSPVIAPDAFRAELRFLVARGARFFTFQQLIAGEFPRAGEFGVAICFDDCFRNNYTLGLEALDEFGIKATFFQTTALVDAPTLLWEHRLYWHTRDDLAGAAFRRVAERILPPGATDDVASVRALVERLREHVPFEQCGKVLDAADVDAGEAGREEMRRIAHDVYPATHHIQAARAGGHEIGSHGHEHLKRTNISAAEFERDLELSSATIRALLNEAPISYSYPFDSHLPTDADISQRHFRVAATVAKRPIERNFDPMWVPRFTWPGPARSTFRLRRWLLTGTI